VSQHRSGLVPVSVMESGKAVVTSVSTALLLQPLERRDSLPGTLNERRITSLCAPFTCVLAVVPVGTPRTEHFISHGALCVFFNFDDWR